MSLPTLSTFVIGCIGATAPEIVRLYNLRSEPRFQWSWGYLLYSIPFILLGGFIAWILEPSSKYAAFYAGISTPVLVTAVAKNSSLGTSTSQSEKSFPLPEAPPQLPEPPSVPSPSASSVEEQAAEEQRRGKGFEPGAPVPPSSPLRIPPSAQPTSNSENEANVIINAARGYAGKRISFRAFLKALY